MNVNITTAPAIYDAITFTFLRQFYINLNYYRFSSSLSCPATFNLAEMAFHRYGTKSRITFEYSRKRLEIDDSILGSMQFT